MPKSVAEKVPSNVPITMPFVSPTVWLLPMLNSHSLNEVAIAGGRTTMPPNEPDRLQGLAKALGKVWDINATSKIAEMMPLAFVRDAIKVTIPP